MKDIGTNVSATTEIFNKLFIQGEATLINCGLVVKLSGALA